MAIDPVPRLLGAPLDPTIFAVLQARLHLNVPPAGFDPRSAIPSDLAKYFLPPRPDATQTPLAFERWHQAMSPPLSFLNPPALLAAFFSTLPPRVSHMKGSNTGQAQETSQNWSGSYVRPRDFKKIMLVQGTWKVPAPVAPAGAGNGTFASSVWVGIDGHDPTSRSMPQIGTGQYVDVAGNTPTDNLFAWWQWWDRFDPGAVQVVIPSLTVNAGDEMYAQVMVLKPDLVSFFLKNLSTGLSLPFWYLAPPPAVIGSGTNARPIRVEGRTAEWIVERPMDPTTLQFYPLVNYDHATFKLCNAAYGTIALGHDEQLQRARLIGMNVWDQRAHPGIRVSTPHRNGSDSLNVRYVP